MAVVGRQNEGSEGQHKGEETKEGQQQQQEAEAEAAPSASAFTAIK